MARVIVEPSGVRWSVGQSGHHTQYGEDETSLEFRRLDGDESDRRYARFSPRGAKAAEMALEELSDRALLALLGTAQPAWTSPDGDYAGTA
ncbi:MAG: hypothetical protein V4503_05150 [Gemmatimonadota bacterium]